MSPRHPPLSSRVALARTRGRTRDATTPRPRKLVAPTATKTRTRGVGASSTRRRVPARKPKAETGSTVTPTFADSPPPVRRKSKELVRVRGSSS